MSQPVIGQTKNTADIRLRDGEVNILSGLSQNSDSSTVGGLPGLTNIPILGQFLFGSSSKNKTTGELMIALIPHIIRTPDYTAENLKGIYAGSDQVVKLYYAPKAAQEPAAPATPPNAAAATAPQAGAPPVTAPAPTAPIPPAPPSAGGRAQVKFAPAAVEAKPGDAVNVSVQIDNVADLFSAGPIRIKYDPAILKLNDATPGELFTRDGVRATSVKDIRNEVGEATVTVARAPATKAISGSGAVLMLNFTAIGKGSGTITFPDFNLKNSQLQPVAATPETLPVRIN
jgi:general secretion pathway protein D